MYSCATFRTPNSSQTHLKSNSTLKQHSSGQTRAKRPEQTLTQPTSVWNSNQRLCPKKASTLTGLWLWFKTDRRWLPSSRYSITPSASVIELLSHNLAQLKSFEHARDTYNINFTHLPSPNTLSKPNNFSHTFQRTIVVARAPQMVYFLHGR